MVQHAYDNETALSECTDNEEQNGAADNMDKNKHKTELHFETPMPNPSKNSREPQKNLYQPAQLEHTSSTVHWLQPYQNEIADKTQNMEHGTRTDGWTDVQQ